MSTIGKLALGVAVAILAACGGGTSPDAGAVDVTLRDFAIEPSAAEIAPGFISWTATNDSVDRVHEFVIVATDVAPDDLPTKPNGRVNEDDATLTYIGRIEDLAAGASQTATYEVASGSYVLFCNVADDEVGAHYGKGMSLGFTVA